MYLKYIYFVVCLNLIISVKSQSNDEDYSDYEAEQSVRVGKLILFDINWPKFSENDRTLGILSSTTIDPSSTW